jgi:hypothetical protein
MRTALKPTFGTIDTCEQSVGKFEHSRRPMYDLALLLDWREWQRHCAKLCTIDIGLAYAIRLDLTRPWLMNRRRSASRSNGMCV